ncbi:DUF1934 domain-containing protein [Ammoniphilus sp. CFH 90114]|uniref:DUF1934 domain-containing protein n=1 Tax=Ammoniphilus sp. CFH 90114 TaxID=2493665 RepID=UPI00100F72B3|nr:DUF1934 domain-containing protein [Ammoniphilus sp. CFH 90114]RXT08720.1 DUF1934 domain-containing protein [Ammoniphilus sp. CFH 90114]
MQSVTIHITTNIKQQGQKLEQTCSGKLFPKGEGWYLVYKEDLGENQEVSSTIKLSKEQVTIIRTGSIRMRQEYIPGQWTEGKYEGPFGMMWMETKTDHIDFSERHMSLSYQLKLNGEDMGRYEVAMKMEAKS